MSLESRKGTWAAFSARALMHIPSMCSDRLMLFASSARRPGSTPGKRPLHLVGTMQAWLHRGQGMFGSAAVPT